MNPNHPTAVKPSTSTSPAPFTEAAPAPALDPASRRGWSLFGLAVLGLSVVWIIPLFALGRLAWKEDLHSHILLVIPVAVYLVWIDRAKLPRVGAPMAGLAAALALAAAVSALVSLWPSLGWGKDTQLALRILGYVFGVAAAGAWFLGKDVMRACRFSFAFLLFLAPLPKFIIHGLEVGLQYASAEVSEWFIVASRTPLIREDLYFRLPGLTLEVAPECSGIRSTLVLLVVSVIAAKMFLQSPWRRLILVLSIIPLGIARNAFRIFTLAYLSVHWDPAVLHSALHKQGGPLFFALSLIPLNLLLWFLYRSERSLRNRPPAA